MTSEWWSALLSAYWRGPRSRASVLGKACPAAASGETRQAWRRPQRSLSAAASPGLAASSDLAAALRAFFPLGERLCPQPSRHRWHKTGVGLGVGVHQVAKRWADRVVGWQDALVDLVRVRSGEPKGCGIGSGLAPHRQRCATSLLVLRSDGAGHLLHLGTTEGLLQQPSHGDQGLANLVRARRPHHRSRSAKPSGAEARRTVEVGRRRTLAGARCGWHARRQRGLLRLLLEHRRT